MDNRDPGYGQSPSRPDSRARDHLANDRTFLAWIRTSLALIGLGFVLARMGLFLERLAPTLLGIGPHGYRGSHEFLITGVAFLIAGTTLCVGSLWIHDRARRGIDSGRFEPARGPIIGLTIFVATGGIAITGLVIWHLLAPGREIEIVPDSGRMAPTTSPVPEKIN